jgi:hypothetical protein
MLSSVATGDDREKKLQAYSIRAELMNRNILLDVVFDLTLKYINDAVGSTSGPVNRLRLMLTRLFFYSRRFFTLN